MAKLNFQQSRMILQKSFYYADLLLKKHFLLLSMFKTVELVNIFEETNIFFPRIL